MRVVNRRVPESLRRSDRAMVEAFVGATRTLPRCPSEMWHDVRRGRRRIWGSLFRAIDEAVASGASLADVLLIPQVLESYTYDAFDEHINRLYRRER